MGESDSQSAIHFLIYRAHASDSIGESHGFTRIHIMAVMLL